MKSNSAKWEIAEDAMEFRNLISLGIASTIAKTLVSAYSSTSSKFPDSFPIMKFFVL